MATTAGTTPNRSYPYPGDSSTTNVPGDLKAALLAVDTDVAALNAAGNVSTADIADSAVTSAKIADGTIVNADINASAAIDKTKISGTAVVQARFVATGGPLSGGGDLSADRTITVATAAITPIYLGLTYAAKSADYTLSDDDHEIEFTSAPATATLPSATGRAGRQFIIRNSAASGTITVSGASVTIPGKGYVTVRSNGTTWDVIEGAYATSSVGLASYRWNAASAAWRLIAYDTGWRSITEIDTSGTVTGDALTASWQAMSSTAGYVRLRRTLHVVQLAVRYLQVTTTTPTTGLLAVYTGFHADSGGYVPIATNGQYVLHSVNASACLGTVAANSYVQGHASWAAPANLPSSLPGSTLTNPA